MAGMRHRGEPSDGSSKTYAVIESSKLRIAFIAYGVVMFGGGMLFGELITR
jgi:hypothetical protein